MELVYLWVEDYKNIHEQGFNFSSKFICDYDGKTLTIDDNPDHIENFFGDNINVTAIVGKNGSGKSSIVELIQNLSYENPQISPFPISALDIGKISIYYNKQESKLYIYFNQAVKITINNQSNIDYEKKDIYDEFFQEIFINATPSHNQKEYILLLDFLRNNNIHFPFNIPQMIKFGIHDDYNDLLKLIESNSFDFNLHYSVWEEDKDKRIKIFHILLLLAYLKNYNIDFEIEASENYDKTIHELENKTEENIKNDINTFISFIKKDLKDFSSVPDHYLDKNKIPDNFFKIYEKIIKRKNNDELLDFKGKKVFNFSFFPSMSDGEYQFTYLFNTIYSSIDKENILLLIDEGENFLHPNWQKKYISFIVQFIQDNFSDKKIHIIFTTHSPFLLSDIPKQNIIFLDKNEEGKCKVVDGLKDKKQTFGANIHTLLSDSFFMEDGLMCEFAKGKINEIIDYLNGENNTKIKSDEEAQKLINIIGEPIVKNQLQRILDSKRLSKVDEIDVLKSTMAEMQKRIDELEQ